MHPSQVFAQASEVGCRTFPSADVARSMSESSPQCGSKRASADHPDFMSSRARCPLFEASGHTNLAIASGIVSALQLFFDGSLGIQHGVGPGKRNASPRFGCMEKDGPFPATWICHFDDFKLDAFVIHGRSSKRRHRRRVSSTSSCAEIDVRDCLPLQVLTTAKVTIGTASLTRLSLQPSVSVI